MTKARGPRPRGSRARGSGLHHESELAKDGRRALRSVLLTLARMGRADPKMTGTKTRCLTTMGVGHVDHQPRRRIRRDTDQVPVHGAADAADATVAADADDSARRQARACRGLHGRRAGARAR